MKLARREKYSILIAISMVVLFLLLQLFIIPFFEKKERLQRGIISKKEGLVELGMLQTKYEDVKNDSQKIQRIITRRKRGFTLFSFLEKMAGEAKVKDNITYMKPSSSKGVGSYSESLVEIKLEAITLEQLIGYLYRIETPEDLIMVKRMSIKGDRKNLGYMDVILQVLTFQ